MPSSNPPDREGVTKFRLAFKKKPPLPPAAVSALEGWRKILYRLGLIGQDPARYEGVGFGNLSRRLPEWDGPGRSVPFLVTGTRTGHLQELNENYYSVVLRCFPAENRIEAEGPVPPSSESMTHGTIYQLDPSVRGVMHIHSPDIWENAARLDLPSTPAGAAYGTPAMAREVERLCRDGALKRRKAFVMGGHRDGVVVFGGGLDECGRELISLLAAALTLKA